LTEISRFDVLAKYLRSLMRKSKSAKAIPFRNEKYI